MERVDFRISLAKPDFSRRTDFLADCRRLGHTKRLCAAQGA